MKPDRYPWNHVETGPEPQLGPDFAASVLSRARIERKRIRMRRGIAAGAICGGLAIGVVIFSAHPTVNSPHQLAVSAPSAQSSSAAPAVDLAADEIGADVPTIAQLAEVQSTPTAQDEGDVFEEFLPSADDVADFASSYSANDWVTDTGWDSNS
jgi:hypothetical protein